MDKKMLTLAAMISGMMTLASCGEVQNTSTAANQTTKAVTTAEETVTSAQSTGEKAITSTQKPEDDSQITEAVNTKTGEQTKAAAADKKETVKKEDKADSSEDTDYQAIAEPLYKGLAELDSFGGSVIDYDSSDTVNIGGRDYYRVTDSRFTCVADISDYIDEIMTDNLINSRYSFLTQGEDAFFADRDGKLYVRNQPRGSGFAFSDNSVDISDVSETSFTADRDYDNYGAASKLTIKVVKTDAGWRIDSMDAHR